MYESWTTKFLLYKWYNGYVDSVDYLYNFSFCYWFLVRTKNKLTLILKKLVTLKRQFTVQGGHPGWVGNNSFYSGRYFVALCFLSRSRCGLTDRWPRRRTVNCCLVPSSRSGPVPVLQCARSSLDIYHRPRVLYSASLTLNLCTRYVPDYISSTSYRRLSFTPSLDSDFIIFQTRPVYSVVT